VNQPLRGTTAKAPRVTSNTWLPDPAQRHWRAFPKRLPLRHGEPDGRRESAKRLRHHDDARGIPAPDGARNSIDLWRQSGRIVCGWQGDGDGLAVPMLHSAHHQMPVPGVAARARDQSEGGIGHRSRSRRSRHSRLRPMATHCFDITHATTSHSSRDLGIARRHHRERFAASNAWHELRFTVKTQPDAEPAGRRSSRPRQRIAPPFSRSVHGQNAHTFKA